MSRSMGLYLVGPPGSGKTTVLREALDLLGWVTGDWRHLVPGERAMGPLRAEPLEDIVTGRERGLHLGITRTPFGGTDALGLNVHPMFLRWSDELAVEDAPRVLLAEGARLATPGAFASIARWCDLAVVHLDCAEELAAARREDRNARYPGSGRHGRPTAASPAYVKTQRTKASKAALAAADLGLPTRFLDSEDGTPRELADSIIDWWGWRAQQ